MVLTGKAAHSRGYKTFSGQGMVAVSFLGTNEQEAKFYYQSMDRELMSHD